MDSISIIKFESVPIPQFKSRSNSLYVKFGDDDYFPYLLIDFLNGSSKHNAIVENKCIFIEGSGMQCEDENDLQTQKFIKKYKTLVNRLVKDLELFNGFYIECLPTYGGGWRFSHIPFETIRKNIDETEYIYKKDWRMGNYMEQKRFPKFSSHIKQPSIIEFKGYRAGLNTYALPTYVSALNYIKADCEVAKHTLGNASTGFTGSKMISFFNGDPGKEKKSEIEKGLKNKFTGSDGSKLLVTWNSENAKKPEVEDLGQSDLTKEDYTAQDNLICTNIYAGHQVNNMALFGIPTTHSLGGDSGAELKLAYEQFCNTYVNARKAIIEKYIKIMATLNGIKAEIKLGSVEPLGMQISENILLKIAPKSYLLDKAGIDLTKYTDATIEGVTTVQPEQQMTAEGVNDNIKNLTAKQHQQVLRIIRQYNKEQITAETATVMLKNGYGLSVEDINSMLGIANESFNEQNEEEFAIKVFEAHGELFNDEDVFDFTYKQEFAEQDNVEAKVKNLIAENPKITATEIAEKTGIDKKLAIKIIDSIGVGGGGVITKIPKFEIRYKYQLRSGVEGPAIKPTTRPFCKRILQSNKLYSSSDIQKMSQILGYDVIARSGGFWNRNGKVDIKCRHEFASKIVVRK